MTRVRSIVAVIMAMEVLAGLAMLDQFYGGTVSRSLVGKVAGAWLVFAGKAAHAVELFGKVHAAYLTIDVALSAASMLGAAAGIALVVVFVYWSFILLIRFVTFVASLATQVGRARWSPTALWHRAIADAYGGRVVLHPSAERITILDILSRTESYGLVTLMVRDDYGKEYEIVADAKLATAFDGLAGFDANPSYKVEECLKPVSPVSAWDSRKACFGHVLLRDDGAYTRVGMFTRLGEFCVVATHEIRGLGDICLAPATKGKFEKVDQVVRVSESQFKQIDGADISYVKLSNSIWSTLGCARGVPAKLNTKKTAIRTYVPDHTGAIRCAEGFGSVSSDLQTFDYLSSTQRGSSGGPVTNPNGVNVYAVHTTGTPDPTKPNHGYPAMYIWLKACAETIEESDYALGWLGEEFDYDPFDEGTETMQLFAGRRRTRKLRSVRRSITNPREYLVEDAYGDVNVIGAEDLSSAAAKYFHLYLERHGHVDESCWEVVISDVDHSQPDTDVCSVDLSCSEQYEEVEESFENPDLASILAKLQDIQNQLDEVNKMRGDAFLKNEANAVENANLASVQAAKRSLVPGGAKAEKLVPSGKVAQVVESEKEAKTKTQVVLSGKSEISPVASKRAKKKAKQAKSQVVNPDRNVSGQSRGGSTKVAESQVVNPDRNVSVQSRGGSTKVAESLN